MPFIIVLCLCVLSCAGASTKKTQADSIDVSDAPAADNAIRFVAMGDTGTGGQSQYDVATAVEGVCAQQGCDFVVLLGDNIYSDGVDSVTDSQWQDKFEKPYANLDLPFYVALGNHDYGGKLIIDSPGLGNEWDKGPIQVAYTDESSKWTMPATYYTVRKGPLLLVVFDTNSIFWDDMRYGDQAVWLQRELEKHSDATWVIGAGHHPYRSNGRHGNAGTYDPIDLGGIEIPVPVPIMDGRHIKRFFDQNLCGPLSLYLSGHDHNRQWLDEPQALCGTELVVTGAGAKLTGLEVRGNQTLFEDDSREGFLHVTINGDKLTGEFYDKYGALDFTHTMTAN